MAGLLRGYLTPCHDHAADDAAVAAFARFDAGATEEVILRRLQRVAHCASRHAAEGAWRAVPGCSGGCDQLCAGTARRARLRAAAGPDPEAD